MLGLVGLEKSGSREELIERLLKYLASPQKLKKDSAAIPSKSSISNSNSSSKVRLYYMFE